MEVEVVGATVDAAHRAALAQFLHDRVRLLGSSNLGATCFVNTLLAFLYAFRPLRERLINHLSVSPCIVLRSLPRMALHHLSVVPSLTL
jgi:hypothetical protein